MKQGSNRRSRSRSGNKRGGGGGGGRNSNFESNGPDVKIRGTAQQVQEKYLALARDATSSGDRVQAEAFFQHADHYHRIVNGDGNNGAGRGRGGQDNRNQPVPGMEQQPNIDPAALATVADPAGEADTGDTDKAKPEPEQAAS